MVSVRVLVLFLVAPHGVWSARYRQLRSSHASSASLGAVNISLSLHDSEGFMDEADGDWTMRLERQRSQMHVQQQSMEACPPLAGTGNQMIDQGIQACFPSCTVSEHDHAMRFLDCKETATLTCVAPVISPTCEAQVFWQIHYEPTFSCEFERRVGLAGEGGKWVCDPYKIARQVSNGGSCLVYSVGSNGQYDFEEAVHKDISPSCEIHTIDINDWQTYGRGPPPAFVHYHKYQLGTPPTGTSLPTVVNALGHSQRTIDLFKIDCEGCEWDTFKEWFGEGVYIRQILVEIHYTGKGAGHGAHDFFKFLFDKGYVVFSKEPNTVGCGGKCLEYSLVKMSPEFAKGLA